MKTNMINKFLCTAILILAVSIAGMAQGNKGKLNITILNPLQQPMENATIELRNAKDSSLVKTALTDKNGIAEFDATPGNYVCKASILNYSTGFSSSVELAAGQTKTVPTLILYAAPKQLTGVTVSAKKPFIQKLSDRIVVNVENSIVSAGSNAIDVLERSPGINIDQNDIISLRGKSGVIIMIDGKPTPMSGADLANYLKGLPSNAIERIDIITNPSAKYDASGNSGVIDIRMKKDQRLGSNGTFNTSYGQGVYAKTNSGITFNYRNKKVNLFGNYNYNYRIILNHLYLDRNFYNNGVYNGGDLKDNNTKFPINGNNARLGMDFFPTKKSIIGFVVTGNFNHYLRYNNNSSIVMDPQKQVTSTFNSFAHNDDNGTNLVGNINFKHTFDATRRELTADIDYGVFSSNSMSTNATKYYRIDGSQMQPDYVLDGDQTGKLTFKTGKVDYTNPLKQGAKFEAGIKTSFVSSDNDAKFYDMSNGTAVNDSTKTNHFLYHENNNAAYFNFSKEYKKFSFTVGLRGEQTNINTEQKMGNVTFDSSYFQLFPSAFVNYKLKEDQTIGLSVSRRIDRPSYNQLNPFLFLIDVSTYATGQPGLLPQLSWSCELSYTRKNLNFSASYSHTKDNQITTLARLKDVYPNLQVADNVTVQVPINISSSDYFGVTVAAPLKIAKWWNMVNNANLFYQKFHGSFSGSQLNEGKPTADIRTNNTFSLKKGWTAELNANLNTGSRSGFMVMDPQWGVAAGVQKTVLKNKGTVRFNVTDIFWTSLPKAVVSYDNYLEKWHATRDTRVATLSFTYRFGNNKVQAARKRTTGSEEERQRAGN